MEVRTTMATLKRLIATSTLVVAGLGTAYGQGSPAEAEQIRARQQIALMETVLAGAISNGAQNVILQLRRVIADYRPRTGQARVSGVRLRDYGVLFHVDVPGIPLPLLWEVLVLEAQTRNAITTIQQLRTQASAMPAGPESSRLMEQANRLQQELALGNFRATQPGRGVVGAASLVPTAISRPPDAEPSVVEDPQAAYTREVMAALIDAMLTNSQALGLKPDESLTVVARDGVPNNPQTPSDSIDARIQVMRVKGSVLAAFQARTISLDEARKQVEVTEQ